jgi:hypothetical protein
MAKTPICSCSNTEIPIYSYDGALVQWVDQKRLDQLIKRGRIACVIKDRKGKARRATLHLMPGEPKPSTLRDYVGTKYSFRQHLNDGRRCYRLRALGDQHNADERNLAPEEVRRPLPPGKVRLAATEAGRGIGKGGRREWRRHRDHCACSNFQVGECRPSAVAFAPGGTRTDCGGAWVHRPGGDIRGGWEILAIALNRGSTDEEKGEALVRHVVHTTLPCPARPVFACSGDSWAGLTYSWRRNWLAKAKQGLPHVSNGRLYG